MNSLVLLLLTSPGWSGTTIQRKPEAAAVYATISNQAKHAKMSCVSELCTIDWTEKPGVPVAFEDKKTKDDDELAALTALVAKWKAGTISVNEKDDLLKRLIIFYLAQRQ